MTVTEKGKDAAVRSLDEVERFKQYSNVIVTYSESRYITEEIWRKVVITQVLFRHKKGGQDFWKRRQGRAVRRKIL